tara:strand:- start:1452 stop:2171 length:720 start_codon:yes stop_codon:yes gene_type:complete
MTLILHKCSIYPLAFDTSTSNIKELLYSTKAIFPDSILDAIILHFKDTPLPEPLTFKITSQLGMSAHVTVHTFSSLSNRICVPQHILNKLCIQKFGEKVSIDLFEPPKGSKIVLQPNDDCFSQLLGAKNILEKVIKQNYPILIEKESIKFVHDSYTHSITIVKTEPYIIISTYNTDIVVEFLPSIETIKREKELEIAKLKEKESKEKLTTQTPPEHKNTQNNKNKFVPFSGKGYRLGGD